MMSNTEINEQDNSYSSKQLKLRNPNSSWKTVGVRIRPQDLPVLNQRLRLYGFETLGQLVADFLTTKFPPLTQIFLATLHTQRFSCSILKALAKIVMAD
jgi:hypothetical protein